MLNEWFETYEVTPVTLAILSKKVDDKFITQIIEDDECFYVSQPPSKVIDLACKFFGSSLRGRQEGVKDICGISHKAPICIDPSSGMYYFPTTSPQNPNCSWISHSHIDQIKKISNKSTQITFKNEQLITVPVSHGSILNQIQRTAQFRYLLNKRIKYLSKSNNVDIVAESL